MNDSGAERKSSGAERPEDTVPEAGVRRYRDRRDRGLDRLLRELHPEVEPTAQEEPREQ